MGTPRRDDEMHGRGWRQLLLFGLCAGMLSTAAPAQFRETHRFGEGAQWRFTPLLVDLNGDGRLDIVATHRKPFERNALHIWLQSPTGELRAVEPTWPSPQYAALAAGDVNADGRMDLLAASHFHKIVTYTALEEGGFSASVIEAKGGFSGAALADLDANGSIEAVVLSERNGGIQVFRRENDAWAHVSTLWTGNIGRNLALADLNKDTLLDIVVAGANDGAAVFMQTAPQVWERRPHTFPSATRLFQSVALGDVNGDGFVDIALNGGSTGADGPDGPEVYLGDGTGNAWRQASGGLKVIGFPARGLALGDVDGDGDLDLLAAGNRSGELTETSFGLFLFRGDGAGGWTLDENSGLPPEGLGAIRGIRLGDLDGDGRLDALVSHGYTVTKNRDGIPSQGGYLTIWSQAKPQ